MSDKAHTQTDKLIADMEAHIKSVYASATSELQVKFDEYMQRFSEQDAEHRQEVADGTLSQADYNEWKINKTLLSQRWQEMVAEASAKYSQANEIATAYINGKMPKVYSINYNQVQNAVSGQVKGYSLTLVDESTVKYLFTNEDLKLPQARVNIPKDMRWNTKQINAQLLQGILQGESNDDIANRLMNVTNMLSVSAIRNARTMTTSCENKGRIDSMERASADGVRMKKVWLSTSDARTRESHAKANGQERNINEAFILDNGNLDYPADPKGIACEVYNCRCTLLTKVVGFGKINHSTNDSISAKSNNKYKITRDYGCNIAKVCGNDYYDAVCDCVEQCDNENYRKMFELYQSEIRIDSIIESKAHCINKSLYFNVNSDKKGNEVENPYETFFHESGHVFDNINLSFDTRKKFTECIENEVNSFIQNKEIEIKKEFEKRKSDGDVDWLYSNKFISGQEYLMFKWKGNFQKDARYKKTGMYRAIRNELLSKYTMKEYGCLSDILEGATDGKINLGVGHGKKYWKERAINGVNIALGKETFAEMTESLLTNPESLTVLKKYLPESYNMYESILNEIAKGAK